MWMAEDYDYVIKYSTDILATFNKVVGRYVETSSGCYGR